GGMEVAARELIPELIAQAPAGTRFTAFVNKEAASEGSLAELLPTETVPVRARNRVEWVLGEQTLLPVLAARAGVDLVHSMASTAPLAGPFRRVVTIHDLIYARFPDAHAGIRARGWRCSVPGRPAGPRGGSSTRRARARTSSRCAASAPSASRSCRSVLARSRAPSRRPQRRSANGSTSAG